jgi:hypothetical protein
MLPLDSAWGSDLKNAIRNIRVKIREVFYEKKYFPDFSGFNCLFSGFLRQYAASGAPGASTG